MSLRFPERKQGVAELNLDSPDELIAAMLGGDACWAADRHG